MQIRRWNERKLDTVLAAELAEACEIHPFLSLMLTSRGLDTPESIMAFLIGQEEAIDPFAYVDMDRAVERLKAALESHQRILVYGDYDTDGITATVLLYTYLKQNGADVLYRIPLRDEGYGLHEETITWAYEQGVNLIVTVDTGVTAIQEVILAQEKGIDVIVTDHHQPTDELPAAVAVVDPHRADCESQFKDLAGVGVAFMLLCAMTGDSEKVFSEGGDLLALGTLADMMPLQGFNRDLMRRCLMILDESCRPGLVALRRLCGLEDKPLRSSSVLYSLAPRLNAAGRIADPDLTARLLLSSSLDTAMEIAEELQNVNARRQEASNNIILQVEQQMDNNPAWVRHRVLVIYGEKWHEGLLGVVAARLVDRYNKPAIVLSVGDDGIAHGSCRSVAGFSIYDAVRACAEYTVTFGGHDMASGVTIAANRLDDFRLAINRYAAKNFPHMPVASIDMSLRLRPDQINIEKLELLQILEPFGVGNPLPLFGLYRMRLDNITAMGNGKHLRLSLSRDGVRISAVKFQTTPEEFPVPCGSTVNCIVSLDRNEHRGVTSVSVRVVDICYADTDREQVIEGIDTFCMLLRGEVQPNPGEVLASREQLARLYNLLRVCKEWNGTVEQLHHALGEDAPTYPQLLTALEIWQEANIVRWYDRGETIRVVVCPVDGKADLSATPLYKYIMKGDAGNV